jgi:hypothetical protein
MNNERLQSERGTIQDYTQRPGQMHELPQREQRNDIIAQLLVMQHRLASAIYLPSPNVPVFNGDPLGYTTFMKSFDMRIASHVDNDDDKLFYLDQQLAGEPKELIGGCLFMNSSDAYKHARFLLEKEYGDGYRIANRYVSKLLSWPQINDEDPQGMKRLSIYLTKCLCAMESISDMTVLNHTPNLQSIVRLLSEDLQQEWREHVHELLKDNKEVLFRELSNFIELVSDRMNHPVYGIDAMKQVTGRTSVSPSELCNTVCMNEVSQTKCPICQRIHDIEECTEFTRLNVEQKRTFLREKHMCYSCYGPNHTSKGCTSKRTCHKCGKPHPTAMHSNNFRLNK